MVTVDGLSRFFKINTLGSHIDQMRWCVLYASQPVENAYLEREKNWKHSSLEAGTVFYSTACIFTLFVSQPADLSGAVLENEIWLDKI